MSEWELCAGQTLAICVSALCFLRCEGCKPNHTYIFASYILFKEWCFEEKYLLGQSVHFTHCEINKYFHCLVSIHLTGKIHNSFNNSILNKNINNMV